LHQYSDDPEPQDAGEEGYGVESSGPGGAEFRRRYYSTAEKADRVATGLKNNPNITIVRRWDPSPSGFMLRDNWERGQKVSLKDASKRLDQ
jgi:hypothetical protein